MLKKLAKRINKEIEQAADYCEQAMLIRQHAPSTADLFVTLSGEEIEHAEKLLKEGHRIIREKSTTTYGEEIKDTHEDSHFEKCKVIWEWENRIATERIAEIKYKLSTYRSM